MKLNNIKNNLTYKIINFGNLNNDKVNIFYEQGIIEGETLSKNIDLKINKNTLLLKVDDKLYAINKRYTQEIEVQECYEF